MYRYILSFHSDSYPVSFHCIQSFIQFHIFYNNKIHLFKACPYTNGCKLDHSDNLYHLQVYKIVHFFDPSLKNST